MANYGQLLENAYNPERQNVYDMFTVYFNNPTMTKLKTIRDYSLYICKIHSLLGIEHRYIMVFVYKDDKNVGYTRELKNLQWSSLQTRTMTEEYNLPPHQYISKRYPGLDKRIELYYQDENQYLYNVESLPLKVCLLPSKKGNSKMEYVASGSLINAIETFNTIITI